ncbi:CWF19-like protein 2, partial [Ophiophagus hannah]
MEEGWKEERKMEGRMEDGRMDGRKEGNDGRWKEGRKGWKEGSMEDGRKKEGRRKEGRQERMEGRKHGRWKEGRWKMDGRKAEKDERKEAWKMEGWKTEERLEDGWKEGRKEEVLISDCPRALTCQHPECNARSPPMPPAHACAIPPLPFLASQKLEGSLCSLCRTKNGPFHRKAEKGLKISWEARACIVRYTNGSVCHLWHVCHRFSITVLGGNHGFPSCGDFQMWWPSHL